MQDTLALAQAAPGFNFGALELFVLAQTGALFYWGGSVRQMLKDHDRRIEVLEKQNAGVAS